MSEYPTVDVFDEDCNLYTRERVLDPKESLAPALRKIHRVISAAQVEKVTEMEKERVRKRTIQLANAVSELKLDLVRNEYDVSMHADVFEVVRDALGQTPENHPVGSSLWKTSMYTCQLTSKRLLKFEKAYEQCKKHVDFTLAHHKATKLHLEVMAYVNKHYADDEDRRDRFMQTYEAETECFSEKEYKEYSEENLAKVTQSITRVKKYMESDEKRRQMEKQRAKLDAKEARTEPRKPKPQLTTKRQRANAGLESVEHVALGENFRALPNIRPRGKL